MAGKSSIKYSSLSNVDSTVSACGDPDVPLISMPTNTTPISAGIQREPVGSLPGRQPQHQDEHEQDQQSDGHEHEQDQQSNGHEEEPRIQFQATQFSPGRFFALWATVPIPTAVLIAIVLRHASGPIFSSAPIGGRLTQFEAKAIDFVCGAILAPLLIASANFCWFDLARTAVFNEKPIAQQPVSLLAVTELSITSSGSYDLLKLWALIRTARPRFILFGILVVASALASSLLANIIAYEAYTTSGETTLLSLRVLYLSSLDSFTAGGLPQDDTASAFGFEGADQVELAMQYTSLMTGLAFQNASRLLSSANGTYIHENVTTSSLNDLPASVVKLDGVPAYQLSLTCEPAELTLLSIVAMGGYSVAIDVSTNTTLYNAYVPGQMDQIDNAYNDDYNFIGFSLDVSSIFLGTMTSGFGLHKPSVPSSPSTFGSIPHYTFNTTYANSTKSTMEVWGIICTLRQRLGSLTLARNTSSTSASWSRSAISISSVEKTVSPILYSFQCRYGYHGPAATLSGIGGALALSAYNTDSNRTLNFLTYAQNFLYATASLQNTVINLALSNASVSSPSTLVQADLQGLFYRISYVPGILFLALVAMTAAGVIVAGLTIYSRGSFAMRAGRILNPARLTFDCVDALRDYADVREAGAWSSRQVKEVARAWKVRYIIGMEAVGDERGGIKEGIRLRRSPPGP